MLVIDTNIWISYALFKKGDLADAIYLALQRFDFAFSLDTYTELETVLLRDKFDPYLPRSARLEFVLALRQKAFFVENVPPVSDCRDKKDNIFLALAKSITASYLVTGDNDLLVLDPYYETRIITVAQLKSFITT